MDKRLPTRPKKSLRGCPQLHRASDVPWPWMPRKRLEARSAPRSRADRESPSLGAAERRGPGGAISCTDARLGLQGMRVIGTSRAWVGMGARASSSTLTYRDSPTDGWTLALLASEDGGLLCSPCGSHRGSEDATQISGPHPQRACQPRKIPARRQSSA